MNLPGQQTPAQANSKDYEKPLRKFVMNTWGGKPQEVQAHYVQFMPEHVTFWQFRKDQMDKLIIAIRNSNVNDLEEK